MIKLIKTIKQERGELTLSVFRTDGQIAYDAVFVPDKKKGEMFRTEIHGVSPLINHEVIIAVDEYLQIEKDLENSGISAHEYFAGLTTRITVSAAPCPVLPLPTEALYNG